MKKIKRYYQDIAAITVIAAILFLFYRSVFSFLLIPVLYLIYRKTFSGEADRKHKEKISVQFKDFLISLSGALKAGYSIENAISEIYSEMKMLYGEDSYICLESRKMINQMRLGITAENIFLEMANRSGLEDMHTFAEVFKVAKRSGGDIVGVIQKTADDIAAKVETKNEISVLIASKRFEQNIMNFVPMGIIAYISLSSSGLLEPLYGNATGIIIMTVCLLMYVIAFILSKKIMNIEV